MRAFCTKTTWGLTAPAPGCMQRLARPSWRDQMALTARTAAVASGLVCRAQAASGKAPGCAERAPANKPDIKANTASMASVHTPSNPRHWPRRSRSVGWPGIAGCAARRRQCAPGHRACRAGGCAGWRPAPDGRRRSGFDAAGQIGQPHPRHGSALAARSHAGADGARLAQRFDKAGSWSTRALTQP